MVPANCLALGICLPVLVLVALCAGCAEALCEQEDDSQVCQFLSGLTPQEKIMYLKLLTSKDYVEKRKPNFIRFGRADPEVEMPGFARFGKRNSRDQIDVHHSIKRKPKFRFGKRYPILVSQTENSKLFNLPALQNLDKKDGDLEEWPEELPLPPITKRKPNFIRFGKRKPNFIRFGKRDIKFDDYEDYPPDFGRFGKSNTNLNGFDGIESSLPISDNFNKLNPIKAVDKRKPNFIRFGKRKPNFIRFGKRKPNFIRFGKRKPNFIRFGKRKPNFIRFGKRKPNFIRFGKRKPNFIRFGKRKPNFIRFGKRKPNFIRFGKRNKDISQEESAKTFDPDYYEEPSMVSTQQFPENFYEMEKDNQQQQSPNASQISSDLEEPQTLSVSESQSQKKSVDQTSSA